jgi:hypothetical protein
LYELEDPRINQIQVKGDMIVPQGDGRIMTRSRAKLRKLPITMCVQPLIFIEPDRFTLVPANLKILKVLVEELHSAAGGGNSGFESAAIEALDDDESADDEEWEDDNNFLDLGLGTTKKGMFLRAIAYNNANYWKN